MEVHPFFPQRALRAFSRSRGILVQAYSSLGQNDPTLREHPVVLEIAAHRSMTLAQVLLRCVAKLGDWVNACDLCVVCVPLRRLSIGYVYPTTPLID